MKCYERSTADTEIPSEFVIMAIVGPESKMDDIATLLTKAGFFCTGRDLAEEDEERELYFIVPRWKIGAFRKQWKAVKAGL
ncbi:hypothetical protein BS639_24195 [Rouxiella silvae]|uniref:Uncharacterized protein n=1 Tax=Rouxiella silvae TaxID=1646373 RepID=A0ABX3TTT8_9GAMM|nr:hypothetical protein [Rouxiella silvae]ORJ18636.1 hypothetical protein BS639_24195 [Rouxiella silvae]